MMLFALWMFTTIAGTSPPKAILMLLADDYGWWNIEMDGHNVAAKTPNLHRLQREGVRLDRHYVYKYCSPTRSSLTTGRLPIHVNQNNEVNTLSSPSGADIRMTTLAQKLKTADPPFRTHLVGKWHCGARSAANLPINRGYDSHIGFLKGAEDHFTQMSDYDGYREKYIDLWLDHAPANKTLNGTYSAFRDTEQAIRIINEHDFSFPLFLDVRFQTVHSPYQVPPQYLDTSIENECRRSYHGMATAMDEGIGNITVALRETGHWDDTLVIFSADNGAPTSTGQCGNNYPLRGGKTTDFEGGVRVSAFLSGGYVPKNARGSVHTGLIHIADWYATLSNLVGVDPADSKGESLGVPPIDSLDQWASVINPTSSSSARDEIPLSYCTNRNGASDDCVSSATSHDVRFYDQGALIGDGGRWKVVFGDQHGLGFFTGSAHPNGTADYKDAGCVGGCLFDLRADPTEHVNLRDHERAIFDRLKARLEEFGRTVHQTNYTDAPHVSDCLAVEEAAAKYGGHLGPQCSPSSENVLV